MSWEDELDRRLRETFTTEYGMYGIWNRTHFRGILKDRKCWEREILEDENIERHIRAGAFVPINLRCDGTVDVEIRIGTTSEPATLSDPETKHLSVASDPYLFRSTGELRISGIEHVSESPDPEVATLAVDRGDWAAVVNLIIPEEGDQQSVLPDFVVLLNPARPGMSFRESVDTFPPPGVDF